MKIKAFKCKDCSKNFLREQDMESHHKRVHLFIKPSKRYTCHECGISFERNKNMESHLCCNIYYDHCPRHRFDNEYVKIRSQP